MVFILVLEKGFELLVFIVFCDWVFCNGFILLSLLENLFNYDVLFRNEYLLLMFVCFDWVNVLFINVKFVLYGEFGFVEICVVLEIFFCRSLVNFMWGIWIWFLLILLEISVLLCFVVGIVVVVVKWWVRWWIYVWVCDLFFENIKL